MISNSTSGQRAFVLSLKKLMAIRGVSIKELSIDSGVSQSTLSRFLSGQTQLRSNDFIGVLEALHISLTDIISEKSLGFHHQGQDACESANWSEDLVNLVELLPQLNKKTLFETVLREVEDSAVTQPLSTRRRGSFLRLEQTVRYFSAVALRRIRLSC